MLGITSGAADFLGPSGIRVCSVSPAVVASALMGPDRIPYFESELEAGVIFPRRTSQPAEVAHAIMYLIENAMMNDFHLKVDGGWRGSSNWGGPKDRESDAFFMCVDVDVLQLEQTRPLWSDVVLELRSSDV